MVETERLDIAKILAENFNPGDEKYDAFDFEWAAYQLQTAGYHKTSEGVKTPCGLCRAGKEIVVYGIDNAPDSKGEYHRIKVRFCPECGAEMKEE